MALSQVYYYPNLGNDIFDWTWKAVLVGGIVSSLTERVVGGVVVAIFWALVLMIFPATIMLIFVPGLTLAERGSLLGGLQVGVFAGAGFGWFGGDRPFEMNTNVKAIGIGAALVVGAYVVPDRAIGAFLAALGGLPIGYIAGVTLHARRSPQ